ncbi:2059_t:CDS:10 [Funneliformis geosporum]|nr:2059_t:CDS:10 [Funneliformis geosporum]
MPVIHMNKVDLKILKQVLSKYPYHFYAYGSRVKGTARKYSDLDLCYYDIPDLTVGDIREDDLVDFFQDLQKRGLIANSANLDNFYQLKSEEKVVYLGIDCTAESLHIGHLFLLIQTIRFAHQGFQVLLVLGGATSKIGDPSDKVKERTQLEVKKLVEYQTKIKEQLQKILFTSRQIKKPQFAPLEQFYGEDPKLLDKNKFQILNNQDWLEKRLETGLSYLAFSYSLLQAYDFYYLYQTYNCHGQLGGSDQWGNLTTGLKLIRGFFPENNNRKEGIKKGGGAATFNDDFFKDTVTYKQATTVVNEITKGLKGVGAVTTAGVTPAMLDTAATHHSVISAYTNLGATHATANSVLAALDAAYVANTAPTVVNGAAWRNLINGVANFAGPDGAGDNAFRKATTLADMETAFRASTAATGGDVAGAITAGGGDVTVAGSFSASIQNAFAHHSVISAYTNVGAHTGPANGTILGEVKNYITTLNGGLSKGNSAFINTLIDDAIGTAAGNNDIRKATTLADIETKLRENATAYSGATITEAGGMAGWLAKAGTAITGAAGGLTGTELSAIIKAAFEQPTVTSVYTRLGANIAAEINNAGASDDVRKATTLTGIRDAIKKYSGIRIIGTAAINAIDAAFTDAFVKTVWDNVNAADTTHADLLKKVFENGSNVTLPAGGDVNAIVVPNPVDTKLIVGYNEIVKNADTTIPAPAGITNPRKILRADEFIAANPTEQNAIAGAPAHSLRAIDPAGNGTTVITVENYTGIHGAGAGFAAHAGEAVSIPEGRGALDVGTTDPTDATKLIGKFLGVEHKGADAIKVISKIKIQKYLDDFKNEGAAANRLPEPKIYAYYFVVPTGGTQKAAKVTEAYKDEETAPHKKVAELRAFEIFESETLFNEVKDNLVPGLVKFVKIDADADLANLKINERATTKGFADTKYNELSTKIIGKVTTDLATKIDEIEGDTGKRQTMKNKMTDSDVEKMLDALELMKKIVEVNKDKSPVPATLTKLKEFEDRNKAKDGKKPDEQKRTSEFIESIISVEGAGYKGRTPDEIINDLKTKFSAKKSEYSLLNDDSKIDAIAKELAPRLKLRDERDLNIPTATSVQKKLAKLLSWVELKYDGKAAADDDGRFNELDTKIKELDKFIDGKDDEDEKKLFIDLPDGKDGKDIVKGLRTKMMKRLDMMKQLRKQGPGETPKTSPLVIISILAVGVALL